jgi:hypothetical protein
MQSGGSCGLPWLDPRCMSVGDCYSGLFATTVIAGSDVYLLKALCNTCVAQRLLVGDRLWIYLRMPDGLWLSGCFVCTFPVLF